MDSKTLPTGYTWRGVALERVVRTERIGGGSFGLSPERFVTTPSEPPSFSGTVGLWRYTLERQANATWVARVSIGGATNPTEGTYLDWVTALDVAASWWERAVSQIPARPEA
jgi:hypothetical protein